MPVFAARARAAYTAASVTSPWRLARGPRPVAPYNKRHNTTIGRQTVAHWSQIPLLTTVVGSYPTADLPPRRAVRWVVEEQIAAGIELIADGQVHGDMIATFAERIPGIQQADDGVWEVRAALDQPAMPITVGDYALAERVAAGRATVKGVITGPVTLALALRV